MNVALDRAAGFPQEAGANGCAAALASRRGQATRHKGELREHIEGSVGGGAEKARAQEAMTELKVSANKAL